MISIRERNRVSIVAHACSFSQDETGGTRYYRCGFYYILLASRHKWDMSIELLLTRAIPDDEVDYISVIATVARSGMSLKRKR